VDVEKAQHWNSRGHFFVAASEAMRRILIESARRKKRLKHGGGHERVMQDMDSIASQQQDEELLALDEALLKFAQVEPLKAQLVELRYFGGLSGDQAASVLGISASTADRYWVYARAWLHRELKAEKG
jgi:RNA polymerase sigma factor (TIGR02999 family)